MYLRDKFERTWKRDYQVQAPHDQRLIKDTQNLYWEQQKADYEQRVYHKDPARTDRLDRIIELNDRIEQNLQKDYENYRGHLGPAESSGYNVKGSLNAMNEVIDDYAQTVKPAEMGKKFQPQARLISGKEEIQSRFEK